MADHTALALSISGGLCYGYHSGVAGPSFGPMHGAPHGLLVEVLGCEGSSDGGCHGSVTAVAVGAFILGAMILNLLGGMIVGWIGRRSTVILAALFSVVGSVITLFAFSFWTFAAFRAVTGAGIGLVSFIVPMCIAEMCENPESRGRIIGYFPLSIVTGILLSYLVGVGISYLPGTLALQWRLVYGIVLLPGAVLVGAAFTVTPPEEDGFKEGPTQAETPEESLLPPVQAADPRLPSLSGHDILFAVGISACQQLTGINAIISYAPGIFVAAGITDATVSALVPNLLNVICTATSGFVVDSMGRRPLLLNSLLAMTVALFAIAAGFAWLEGTAKGVVVMVFVLVYYAGFALGPGPLFYVICAETFSDDVREKAMSLANFLLWSCNLTTVVSFPLLEPVIGEDGLFLACGIVGTLCTVFVFGMVRETKDVGVLSPRQMAKAAPSPSV